MNFLYQYVFFFLPLSLSIVKYILSDEIHIEVIE